MASSTHSKTPGDKPSGRLDIREQLVNDGLTGPAHEIQVPAERITQLLGFMFDLDPGKLIPDNPIFPPADTPRQFHENIRAVLDRHPLVRHAGIRSSGTGVHPIVLFNPAVELTSAADQQRWSTLVRAHQCTLPGDPNAPGITALTRPVGAVNSKYGATVEQLHPGEPVDPRAVEAFIETLARAPFRTVATILIGADRISPCPICRGEGTRLDVLDQVGMSYGCCGQVTLGQLYDSILRPDPSKGAEPAEAAAARVPAPKKRAPKKAKTLQKRVAKKAKDPAPKTRSVRK